MTPPPNLDTLPAEVLGTILYYIDRNSLVTQKRVSRAFLTLDDGPLWENLLLTLPRYYGALPLIYPHTRYLPLVETRSYDDPVETPEYLVWAKKEADSSRSRLEIALREKVKQILKAADTRAWSKVKTVTMTPRTGSIHLMFLILDYAQEKLQSLTIDASPLHPSPKEDGDNLPTHRFDPTLLDFPLLFPYLTHIILRSLSSCDGDFLLQLLHLAPNLESLDVEFDGRNTEPFDEDNSYSFKGLVSSKIHRIRAIWDSRSDFEDYPALQILVRILDVSPEARQIVLDCHALGEGMFALLTDAMKGAANLRDLRWPLDGPGVTLPRLSRIVKFESDLRVMLAGLGEASSLEVLCVENSIFLPYKTFRMIESPHLNDGAQELRVMASHLRSYPSLHTIYPLPLPFHTDNIAWFDELDETDWSNQSGVIAVTSIQRSSDELIQISVPRLWAHRPTGRGNRIMLTAPTYPPYDPNNIPACFLGDRGSRHLRQGASQRLPDATMCTFADYRGKPVPSTIIQRMREMAGDSVENWDRRGVEVGPDVWQVLDDWYEALAVV